MGPRTQAFEAALAEESTCRIVVCVSSGTAALHLACLRRGARPGRRGDRAVGLTFVATAAAVRYCGAEPVFCDVGGRAAP